MEFRGSRTIEYLTISLAPVLCVWYTSSTPLLHKYMTNPDSLKKALTEAIDLACWNQREIAEKSGLTGVTLTNWRRGRRNPAPRHAMEVGRTLLERAHRLQRAAHEVMRLAREERPQDHESGDSPSDPETLELFYRKGEIG